MQYFLGYSSFTAEPPFDASLLVEFRKCLGVENINAINERIVALKTSMERPSVIQQKASEHDSGQNPPPPTCETEHKGQLIMDATACPQDIAYPTDLNLLNDAREKLEELIDYRLLSRLAR